MKNEAGFINKKFIQPDYYKKVFGNWAAVYFIGNDEYHIQSISDPYDTHNKNIAGYDVLKQSATGRNAVRDCVNGYPSIKMAIGIIEQLKNREDEKSMKKYIMAEAFRNNTYKTVTVDDKGNKVFLNGDYVDFAEADQNAKLQSKSMNAEYVCNS